MATLIDFLNPSGLNLLCRFHGHVGHEGLLICRSSQADFESGFGVRAIDAWECTTAVDGRELRADEPAVGLRVFVDKGAFVEALQSVCQLANEIQRDRNVRQTEFRVFNCYHITVVVFAVVASVIQTLVDIAPIDFVHAAAEDADLRDVHDDGLQLLYVMIARHPNVDSTAARCVADVRLQHQTVVEKYFSSKKDFRGND